MNNWVIVGIIVGILLVGGVAFVSAVSTSANQTDLPAGTKCSSCGGKCTAGNNCGLATCGAANGGKCTCGQK
jgi:hypothetical protein